MRDVAFAGFVNQRELPRLLAASDVFVLPSENEPWGLIVNEAMCAALPVIVSGQVGCAMDLVTSGDNGRVVRLAALTELAAALRPLLIDGNLRKDLGERSRARIREWGYRQRQDGVLGYAAMCRMR